MSLCALFLWLLVSTMLAAASYDCKMFNKWWWWWRRSRGDASNWCRYYSGVDVQSAALWWRREMPAQHGQSDSGLFPVWSAVRQHESPRSLRQWRTNVRVALWPRTSCVSTWRRPWRKSCWTMCRRSVALDFTWNWPTSGNSLKIIIEILKCWVEDWRKRLRTYHFGNILPAYDRGRQCLLLSYTIRASKFES